MKYPLLAVFLIFPFANGLEYEPNINLLRAFKIIHKKLVQNYFVNDFSLISLDDNERSKDLKEDYLKNVFLDNSIKIADLKTKSFDQHKNSVLLIEDMKAFEGIQHFIEPSKFQYSGFHIIILINGDIQDVHKIFTVFWSKSIYKVYALLNDNETLLATFEPFENPSKCGDTSPKVINKFSNGKFKKPLILVKKFNNLNKCPIIVGTYDEAISSFKQSFTNGSFVVRGFEMELIKIIAQKLNFTLDLRFREGFHQWGVTFENGTVTETLNELKNRRIDIGIGNYNLRPERAKFFDYSTSYLSYRISFVLSEAEKLTSFEKLLRPFQSNVWILFLIFFGVGVLVIFIIDYRLKALKSFVYGYKVKNPILNMLTAVVGSSQRRLPKRNFARFILMMFILYCLVLRSLYQGSLFKFLQLEVRHKQPDNIQELIENKFNILVSLSTKENIRRYHPQIYGLTKVVHNFSSSEIDALVSQYKKSAVFVSKLDLIAHSQTREKFPYKILTGSFYTANVVMYYNRPFFLKQAIDEVLHNIKVSGLLKHWISEYDKTARWKNKNILPKILTLKQLSGAFCLLMIGCVVGVLMLLLEILCSKIQF